MKYFYALNLLTILLVRCSSFQPEKNKIPVIDIENMIENNQEIPASDVVSNITYTPLQTNNKCFIRYISKALFTKDYILINNNNKELYCFNYDGQFVKQIGREGRGPGEFNEIIDIAFNESLNNIYILSSNTQIDVFSLEGKYLKSLKIDSEAPGTIASIDNFIVINNNNDAGKATYRYVIYNTDGELISRFENPYHFDSKSGIFSMLHECFFYEINSKLFVKDFHSDTIYSISSDNFSPEIVLQTGKYAITPQVRSTKEFVMDGSKNIMFTNILESKNKLYVKFRYDKKTYTLLMDKTTKKNISPVFLSNNKYNSFDGGIEIKPSFYFLHNNTEYFVQTFFPYELKTYILSDDFKSSTPKYPEKKKQLEELANSLDENDNPVLMLVKLKE